MNILVTGASGFVGSAIFKRFLEDKRNVFGLTRSSQIGCKKFIHGDILALRAIDLRSCQPDVIIHCAGMTKSAEGSVHHKNSQLYRINVGGAINIARQASQVECKRFIFLSSAKVNGESTQPGRPFKVGDAPCPSDPYAISKWEAEKRLIDITKEVGMELVIIRPPLIYGPGMSGNLAALAKLVDMRLPLPFGAIDNQRSMLFVQNLVDLIERCLEAQAAAGQTFLVSDADDLSTTEIIRSIAAAKRNRSYLLPFPPTLIDKFGKLIKREAEIRRLTSSLQVDPSHVMDLLGWAPRFTAREGLELTFT